MINPFNGKPPQPAVDQQLYGYYPAYQSSGSLKRQLPPTPLQFDPRRGHQAHFQHHSTPIHDPPPPPPVFQQHHHGNAAGNPFLGSFENQSYMPANGPGRDWQIKSETSFLPPPYGALAGSPYGEYLRFAMRPQPFGRPDTGPVQCLWIDPERPVRVPCGRYFGAF